MDDITKNKPRGSYKKAAASYTGLLEKKKRDEWNGIIPPEDFENIKYAPQIIYKTCRFLLRGRDIPKELDDILVMHKSPRYSYLYLAYKDPECISDDLREKLEDIICLNPIYSLKYARLVLKGPFKKGEVEMFKVASVRDSYVRLLQSRKERGWIVREPLYEPKAL